MKKSLLATVLASSAFFVCPAIAHAMDTDGDIPADMASNAESLRSAASVVEVDGEVSAQGVAPVLQEKAANDCENEPKQGEPCGGSDGEQSGKVNGAVEGAEGKQDSGFTSEL